MEHNPKPNPNLTLILTLNSFPDLVFPDRVAKFMSYYFRTIGWHIDAKARSRDHSQSDCVVHVKIPLHRTQLCV